jgi:hypothetical protein
MKTVRSTDAAKGGPAMSLGEFLDLVRQPYSQPTIASLLESWFGYDVSGSHDATEVRSMTGQLVDLETIYRDVQANAAYKAAMGNAASKLQR